MNKGYSKADVYLYLINLKFTKPVHHTIPLGLPDTEDPRALKVHHATSYHTTASQTIKCTTNLFGIPVPKIPTIPNHLINITYHVIPLGIPVLEYSET